MHVRHLSLDIWGTLFKSNPNYSRARARRLYLEMLGSEPNEDQILNINSIYKEVGKLINVFEAKTGSTIPIRNKHRMVLTKLGYPPSVYDTHFYQREIMQDLFLRNKPRLLHWGIPGFISEFEDRNNSCTLIISNTQYISGTTLLQVLESYGFDAKSKRCYFTDEHAECKPSLSPFKEMYSKQGIDPRCVLHVGDSQTHDIDPAKSIGIQTYKIEGEDSWSSLFRILKR